MSYQTTSVFFSFDCIEYTIVENIYGDISCISNDDYYDSYDDFSQLTVEEKIDLFGEY